MPAIECTTEELTCECTACRHCDGEGAFYSYVTVGHSKAGLPRQEQITTPCSDCNGTGTFHGDCEVHGFDDVAPPRRPAVYAGELEESTIEQARRLA